MKTIEYPLLATTLTKKQLDRIMSPILQVGLPRSGICRTVSWSLVFSSIKYQGFGLIHPFVTQGVRKLLQLFNSASIFNQQLVSTAYNTTMIESGLGPHFLEQPYKPMRTSVERTWISTLWEFVQEYAINLRQNSFNETIDIDDNFIMTKAVKHRIHNISLFNACRLYLQVERVTDILTATVNVLDRLFGKDNDKLCL
jgi:hypothetical protein